MITKDQLLDALGSRLGAMDIIEVRPNILRALVRYKDCPYSVHYFDLTRPFFNDNFSIDAYQKQLLSEDYYRSSGYLKWNFYLDFVVSEEDLANPTLLAAKRTIERNEFYARKGIASLALLKQFFSPPAFTQAELPKDFRDLWLEKLQPSRLQEILDADIGLDNVVERYLDTTGATGKAKGKRAKRNTAPKFPPIASVVLNVYRPYPQKRSFKFADFNLVHGPNASGKTSLLEVVELIVCGATARNPMDQPKFVLTAELDSKEVSVTREDDHIYRDRDASWYGRSYVKGNDLCHSFSRFNFFDSDAAARFADHIERREFGAALESIVFGAEAKELEIRIQAIRDRFAAGNRSANSAKQKFAALLLSENARLQSLKIADPSSVLRTTLDLKLQELQFTPVVINSSFDTLSATLLSVIQDFEIALGLTERSSSYTMRDIGDRLDRLAAARQLLVDLDSDKSELVNRKRQLEAKRVGIEVRDRARRRIAEYISNKAVIPLLELTHSNLREEIRKREVAAKRFMSYAVDAQVAGSTVTDLIERTSEAIRVSAEELAIDSAQLSARTVRAEQARLLIRETRTSAARLLELTPGLADCPVCGTRHAEPSLAEALSKLTHEDAEDPLLTDFARAVELESGRNKKLRQLLEQLEALVEAGLALGWQVGDSPIANAAEAIKQAIEGMPTLRALLASIEREKAELLARGFSSMELVSLLNSLSLTDSDVIRMSGDNPPAPAADDQSVDAELDKLDAELDKIAKSRMDALARVGISDQAVSESQLEVEIENYRRALDLLRGLHRVFVVSPDVDLAILRTRLQEVKIALEYLMAEQRKSVEIQAAEKRIHDLTSDFRGAEIRADRAAQALGIIDELLDNAGLSKRLEFFLRSSGAGIRETFLRIHAPREFSDLSISSSEISLTRTDGTKATARELSTGQRTALALSVFLTMNSLLRVGPDLLLFDDPVVYVDDLNLLSFLDLLREIAASKRRQVFFATANGRVAKLIEAKFSFLGGDFVSCKLDREDNQGGEVTLH